MLPRLSDITYVPLSVGIADKERFSVQSQLLGLNASIEADFRAHQVHEGRWRQTVNEGHPVWGAIDVGSNSVRFLAAQVVDKQASPLWRHLETTRLGRDVSKTGSLHPGSIERTMDALRTGVNKMRELGAEPPGIAAFATSAVREARDGAAFCQRVKEELNIDIRILSGDEEGRLSYDGAVNGLPSSIASGNIPVVLDIGGGSAEVVFREESWWRQSFPLGAVRLTESGLDKEGIGRVFTPVVKALRRLWERQSLLLVGVGGTATTLGAMTLGLRTYDPDKVHGLEVQLQAVRHFAARLRAMDISERKKVAGLQLERADIIPAGLLVLETFMEEAAFDRLVVSETDLLYNALWRVATGEWPPK